MVPVSVVIIAKNEAEIIAQSINKALLITHDIVVIDNGSTDDTVQIVREAGCRVYTKKWYGYAANKNKGIELAEYDWILSIDADEVPDDELINTLSKLNLDDANVVYDIKFKSYFGDKLIRFGKWGHDHHIRLFNRTQVKWSDSPVHETLDIPTGIQRKKLQGNLQHYSVKDINDFHNKSVNYAHLCAKKYYLNGKRSTFVKLYLSSLFNFVKNYVLRFGFLDGVEGWAIASLTVKHTRLKYTLLQKLEESNTVVKPQQVYIDDAVLAEY
jgi:glycosyltransferase involved in cell wall biosynthesis